MIQGGDDGFTHDFFQGVEIDNHAGIGIDFAGHGHLEAIIMAMVIGVGALAENLAVLIKGHPGGREPVRRAEMKPFSNNIHKLYR